MKTQIHSAAELKDTIAALRARESRQKQQLQENVKQFTEELKPANLLKSAFGKVTSSPDIRNSILKTVTGLGVGFLTKRLLIGASTNIFKKLAGNAVKLGVTGIVARKSESIKYAGLKLLTKVLGPKKSKKMLH